MTPRYLPDGRCDEPDCCPICYDEEENPRRSTTAHGVSLRKRAQGVRPSCANTSWNAIGAS